MLKNLKGKKILITAGPTIEHIDPVRFISNSSTGKMGYAIAEELHKLSANVILVSGPVSINTTLPASCIVNIKSAYEMLLVCKSYFDEIDAAIFCAAVADYRPEFISLSKIKKSETLLSINLIPNPDIAFEFSKCKKANQVSVGFALETDDLLSNGYKKLVRKKFDFIVLNQPHQSGSGFGFDTNKIQILDKLGQLTEFELKPKSEVAKDIIAKLSFVLSAYELTHTTKESF